jgi:predicted MFS family arabinose efflux permease
MSDRIPLIGVRHGTLCVMALACGVMVANIYLCQPLLAAMAAAFGVPASHAALVSVVAQIGYALGILFVVPLADVADTKKLVRRLMMLATIGLLAAAFAPSISVLLVASLLIAATSIVAQVLIPIATTLAAPEYRGRIVSVLSTGLILGILLSRTVSGAVAQLATSWRASYLLQAALVFSLSFVVLAFLPGRIDKSPAKLGYGALLRSLPALLRHGPLRLSMALSFCVFAAFSAIWATLAFHLASPAFALGPAAAGLFGLWGAPGALLAPVAGRLSDRFGPTWINVGSLVALLASLGVAVHWGATSLVALIVMVNLLDFGTQSGQVANQARIFGLGDQIRGRLNTLYMVTTFAGGATGAFAGGMAWTAGGWSGVCILAFVLVGIAALTLAASTLARSAAPRQAA